MIPRPLLGLLEELLALRNSQDRSSHQQYRCRNVFLFYRCHRRQYLRQLIVFIIFSWIQRTSQAPGPTIRYSYRPRRWHMGRAWRVGTSRRMFRYRAGLHFNPELPVSSDLQLHLSKCNNVLCTFRTKPRIYGGKLGKHTCRQRLAMSGQLKRW